ncbi:MAG: cytochrome c [Chloroflexi bacterium]|nr:cytochrome c [Chloroflexota bacterium]
MLDESSLASLAAFLSQSLINENPYIDFATKKPIAVSAEDAAHGAQLYESVCLACHGTDGKLINFGSAEEPEYVGTIAVDNPWEFVHKVRYGQPNTTMPSALVTGWSLDDTIHLLVFPRKQGIK